ncbi:MAG TPA: hypothetical protein VFW22_16300 [Pseudolabrys sp.]|nr:hypothetical protein [Pseudolabrys sp.]
MNQIEPLTDADRRADRALQAELRKPGMVLHGGRVMHWRERATLPKIDAEFFAYEPYGGQGFFFIERRLFSVLRDLGAVHFRSWEIRDRFDVPPYPLGVYAEGWRIDPADMDPPHREGDFWFPLVDGVPHCSASELVDRFEAAR